MTLTKRALELINNTKTRLRIAMALGITEQSVIRLIKSNNDILTKAAAVKVIKEDTGLTDKDIFQTDKVFA